MLSQALQACQDSSFQALNLQEPQARGLGRKENELLREKEVAGNGGDTNRDCAGTALSQG